MSIERITDWWWSVKSWIKWPIASFYETSAGQWWCERRGHAGVIWFNPGGNEPDMHCKRCGRDLG